MTIDMELKQSDTKMLEPLFYDTKMLIDICTQNRVAFGWSVGSVSEGVLGIFGIR